MANREEQWIEREYYRVVNDKISSFIRKNHPKQIALLGQPKTGKTLILRQILRKEKSAIYIDLKKIGLSPESFAIEFIGNIIFHFLKDKKQDYQQYFDLNFLLTLKDKIEKNAFGVIEIINNELQKVKPDQRLLVELAFNFVESFASNKKIIILIDNFENIFELNNFLQIKDIISIINFNQKNVSYIVASSAINRIKSKFENARTKFGTIESGFEVMEIKNFDFNETSLFLKNFDIVDKKLIERIHKLTNGNPHLINIFADFFKKNLKEEKCPLESFFISRLLCKNEKLYAYCNNALNEFLSRTSGKTLSKIILKAVAFSPGLRLTEIAKKIYKSAPVTKALIERLIASDVVCKKDSRYYFHDPVLALWLKLTSQGYEFDDIGEITDEAINDISKQI